MAARLICRRPLGVSGDPLSLDCSGDCWGCVGAMEYDSEGPVEERARIEPKIRAGLRAADGAAKPYGHQPSRTDAG